MRLQVNLARDISVRVQAKVMLEQGQRHDQWHDAVQVLANQLLTSCLSCALMDCLR